jgi:hypothetical protein
MLRKLIASAVAGAALALSAGAFAQGQVGTAAEAKAMLEKAVAELKANEATALAKFNKGEGGFKDRDLYVFCFDMNARKTTAHVNQSVIGSARGISKKKMALHWAKSVCRHERRNHHYGQLQFSKTRDH